MVRFGGFLHAIYLFYFAKQDNFYGFNLSNWFDFKLDRADYFSILFAVTLLFIQGIRSSQTQHIYLEKSTLKYKINRQEKAKLNLANLETILFCPVPTPKVLLLTEKEAITIHHLPTLDTHREMVEKIEKTITIS